MRIDDQASGENRRSNIAIIGGGISGLGAAYKLSPYHNVTVFEARDRFGGHARTLMAGPNGDIPVDTGFMVFNYRNYPHINELFEDLDVPVKESNMSFTVSLDDGEFEYGLHNPGRLFADKRNLYRPSFYKMLLDVLKFNKKGGAYKNDLNLTMGQLIETLKLGDGFRDNFLCPLAGAIWSTSREDILDFPAYSLISFFQNHGLMSATDNPTWYTPDGGSKIYVQRLVSRLTNSGCELLDSTPVTSVKRTKSGVSIKAGKEKTRKFDTVIFACHSDQALKMIADPSAQEQHILGSIKYKSNQVILHADTKQMPKRRPCWSSWVYKGQSDNPGVGSFTYWMNLLQSIPNDTPLFVTLNPQTPIDEDKIYNKTELSHPQYSLAALKAQMDLPSIQGQNRSWFCGAWTAYGFHEDGLSSGINAAKLLSTKMANA